MANKEKGNLPNGRLPFTIEGEGKMIIHILAGGPAEYCADFSRYENEEVVWAAVDRGVYRLLKRGITPAVALGIMIQLLMRN